jgi:hypothetical protein
MIMFVNDIGLSWFTSSRGDSLGIGTTLANFHRDGTICSLIEMLKIWVTTGAK